MKFNDYKKYPKFNAYLRNYMPTLELIKPEIFKVFVKYCGSEDIARTALQFNRGPVVLIKTPLKEENILGEFAGGCFRGNKGPHEIWINPTRAIPYEGKENVHVCDLLSGADLEKIVLHELVHWGRYHAGQTTLYNGAEAGTAFEKEAYPINMNYQPGPECKR